ncbi:MAG: cupin domain-containing protein [Ginsengibacter sp.]
MKKTILICGLAIFVLFAFKKNEPPEITVVKLAESSKSWNGADLPPYSEGKPQVTVLKITIPPHTKLSVHKHLEINAGVLTKGELTVIDEKGDTLNLKAGDAIVEMVNAYHYGENKGSVPAEIIVFYAGVEGVPITVTKQNENTEQ